MENQMTVKDVLKTTIGIMENLMIPGKYLQQIGEPINGCIQNLKICVNAMDEADKKATENEPQQIEEDAEIINLGEIKLDEEQNDAED